MGIPITERWTNTIGNAQTIKIVSLSHSLSLSHTHTVSCESVTDTNGLSSYLRKSVLKVTENTDSYYVNVTERWTGSFREEGRARVRHAFLRTVSVHSSLSLARVRFSLT